MATVIMREITHIEYFGHNGHEYCAPFTRKNLMHAVSVADSWVALLHLVETEDDLNSNGIYIDTRYGRRNVEVYQHSIYLCENSVPYTLADGSHTTVRFSHCKKNLAGGYTIYGDTPGNVEADNDPDVVVTTSC